MMREPGFMGLAKQKAKREGMFEVPKRYQPQGGGAEEYPAFLNEQEMGLLKQQGGSGHMTPHGIPSFAWYNNDSSNPTDIGGGGKKSGGEDQGQFETRSDVIQARNTAAGRSGDYTGQQNQQQNQGRGSGGPSEMQIKAQQEAAAKKAAEEAARKAEEARVAAAKQKVKDDRQEKRDGFVGEYKGYQDEAAGLGGESKGITDQFGKDAENLAGYQSKFDKMGADAKTRGDAGEKFQQEQGVKYSDEAGKGQTAASEAATGIKTATAQGQTAAQTGVTAAGKGAEGFQQGAQDVAGVQGRFGEEGFEKDVQGYESKIQQMGDKAMSGDVGQSQAAMLKGQMEEGRMASQKGSEEKLRREMAQSGASPAEIASKVAQFQKSSAGQQAQAGRSETLSSQLQGQQMGQSQLGQAAGLMGQGAGMSGQRAGMAGQQASLGAQQAALRGQAAGMQMQGAQMGMSGAQMGMQGAQQAGQMGMAGASMGMQGAQGNAAMNAQGNQIGMAGANQQASMMGQGMNAVQAAGGARQQQMAGLDQQGGFVDQQGQYTQAQLNDTMAQQTQAYTAEQAELTRKANAAANSGGGGGGNGGILGGLTKSLGLSDSRLKNNISLLEKGKGGDPNIYSFSYIWDSKTIWSGVMAQELLDTKNADAVAVNPEGFYMVDYGKLGIEMKQLSK